MTPLRKGLAIGIIGWSLLFLATILFAQGSIFLNSTGVQVNIGQPLQARFGFGPATSPYIGATNVYVQCQMKRYIVITNFYTASQQSGMAPLTCAVSQGPDPDGDSNQLTSVTVTSAQQVTIGSQTFLLTSANFQSEHQGEHNQSVTLGGSAVLQVDPPVGLTLVGGGTGGGGHH